VTDIDKEMGLTRTSYGSDLMLMRNLTIYLYKSPIINGVLKAILSDKVQFKAVQTGSGRPEYTEYILWLLFIQELPAINDIATGPSVTETGE
jgi:hypothetical protein